VKDALRSADTLSNHIYDLADECRIQLREILQEPLECGTVCVSPDLWSDNHRKVSYMGTAATFVNDKFEFKTVDLSCKPYTGDNQGAENVLLVSIVRE
jgi:hypothetical protein